MLSKLSIYNYAIIDKLEIDFSDKLNIVTGETGAGKSIIVGALNLILGERADSTALVNKDKKCIIEGTFNSADRTVIKIFLQDNDLDTGHELVVRREISGSGKSRAFINDTPVNLSQLQGLSSLLVDLHQQFDTIELTEYDFQRNVLDALANNGQQLEQYKICFSQWEQAQKEYEQLKLQKQQFEKEADYHAFQFTELDEAGFKENELENSDAEIKMLSNAEGIKNALGKVHNELQEGENPIVQQLKSLLNQLHVYSSFHTDLPELLQRLQITQIELKDIAAEIDRISGQINYDAKRIEELNDRLSLGYKLLKKHAVNSTNDLIRIYKELELKLQAVVNIDELIHQKEKEVIGFLAAAKSAAVKISDERKKQAKPFAENVNKLLVQVGMPNAKLKVESKEVALNCFGMDSINFLFDANKSGQFQPLSKVASGGELSRLMLCIKSLIAQSVDLPTMIFDEIDTGISGESAKQVGVIMKGIAAKRQVICITHQPQIAGKADAHFFVYKEINGNTVSTNIRLLNKDERITAIAKMLSGEKPTAAAMENAKEMLMN